MEILQGSYVLSQDTIIFFRKQAGIRLLARNLKHTPLYTHCEGTLNCKIVSSAKMVLAPLLTQICRNLELSNRYALKYPDLMAPQLQVEQNSATQSKTRFYYKFYYKVPLFQDSNCCYYLDVTFASLVQLHIEIYSLIKNTAMVTPKI